MTESKAFAIGIGSNLGDRHAQVEHGLQLLEATAGIDWVRSGPRIETEPVLPPEAVGDQPRYLNTVAIGATTLAPRPLLSRLLAIETQLGRRRRGGCDPRTLDLDLLVHETGPWQGPGIEIPHPRLGGRDFVLGPLGRLMELVRDDPTPEVTRVSTALESAFSPFLGMHGAS